MIQHLLESKIAEEQIIGINFESYDFKKMSVDFDCDIYITGSNAYLLSSE